MSLAQRQAALVSALVSGGEIPPGFDESQIHATTRSLLHKRAHEVAAAWPHLSDRPDWMQVFCAWAANRPPQGSLRDGWDFALAHPPTGAAAVELTVRQSQRKRGLVIRYADRTLIIALAGRVHAIRI